MDSVWYFDGSVNKQFIEFDKIAKWSLCSHFTQPHGISAAELYKTTFQKNNTTALEITLRFHFHLFSSDSFPQSEIRDFFQSKTAEVPVDSGTTNLINVGGDSKDKIYILSSKMVASLLFYSNSRHWIIARNWMNLGLKSSKYCARPALRTKIFSPFTYCLLKVPHPYKYRPQEFLFER